MSKTLQHSRFFNQRSLYHQLNLSLASLTDIMQATPEPIAIIGSGCRFPGGSNSPSKLWELLKSPRDLSTKVPSNRFNIDTFCHPEATHHGTTNATKSYFLDEDVTQFDAGFFSIQPMESEAMDPQQRLLLETVYDSLCAAGLRMESLRGSPTAVYVGMMCDDWSTMVFRDWELLPTYSATGVARSIVSNRISYFFDWHGPSMTLDTACSSSLVAVHHAIQALRSGESKIAVASGTNLILSPAMYIAETNLRMLSPSGRCSMWDVAADGYARGEGVAVVVLKTLRQALADGDPIECVIRETGVNQDGRTTGLTVPSNLAQAALIRDTYRRAGLDLHNPEDRPQFFHAHGTGTQAGDPQEAEAISSSLFPEGMNSEKKLYVGSIKTVIGHTEGCAGLASLIGASLAMRNGVVPPNLHFSQLSPKVEPFYGNLHIPTEATSWPIVGPGQVRRVSINSFGFGGTNAHAIIETYEAQSPAACDGGKSTLFTPLTFSAASKTALLKMLSDYSAYLDQNPDVKLSDLAWTLQDRRSVFPYRKVVAGTDLESLAKKLATFVGSPTSVHPDLSVRHPKLSENPRILGVFTGQGAQWPRMGAILLESSAYARQRISELDSALQSLPEEDRPRWTILNELLAGIGDSRISEAALSQPLCTAVQILLVDILHTVAVTFTAVTGHSSGEIGAAYAAGLLSADDAIRIAYYRGLYAKLAASPNGSKGGMMAVGTSHQNALDFCQQQKYLGRIAVAAVNSSSSVTLSGDIDAIDEAHAEFKDKQIFARKLKVDTAYHSAHMLPCSDLYLKAMKRVLVKSEGQPGPVWFSSVYDGAKMSVETLDESYWVENMCQPVFFASALAQAVSECGQFDLAIEIGPHPALKGPATANLEELGTAVPYTGVIARGQNDVEELATFLGFLWTRLGPDHVKLSAAQSLLSGSADPPAMLTNLPLYPFDHHRSYWSGSRISNHYKHRKEPPNPILGTICSESITMQEVQWRNILRPAETPFLKGHKLQGQTVFPATGYVSMAIEAMKSLAGQDEIKCFKLSDIEINRAISINDDGPGVETVFSVSSIERTEDSITAKFACHSLLPGDQTASLNARGHATIQLAPPVPDRLHVLKTDAFNLVDVNTDNFYASLRRIGYEYSHPFQGLSLIRRKPNFATGLLTDQSDSEWQDNLLVHPGMLDTALQSAFAAWAFPGDTHIWSLHVPTHISSITINPYFTSMALGKQTTLRYEAFIRHGASIEGDIQLYTENGDHSFVRFEAVKLMPFSPASASNDIPMFSSLHYCPSNPDGILAAQGETLTPAEVELYKDIERIAFWYVRHVAETIKPEERSELLPHFKHYLRWCDRMVGLISRGENHQVSPEALSDTRDFIATILQRYKGRDDVRFVEVVGDHLIEVIRAGTSMLEYMNQDGLLSSIYDKGLAAGPNNRWLSRVVGQIATRYPDMHILEIGAGTGGTTDSILPLLGHSFSSYTFTDISSGFFPAAEKRFEYFSSRMIFKTFDMEKLPVEQGFTEGHYDLIIAANVLHVSPDMEGAMANIRRLLKPGGYLIGLEVTNTELMFSGMTVGTLPGWWSAADIGRPWGPALTLDQWSNVLQKTGYSGVDSTTPDISSSLPVSVFITQAVDDRVSLLRNPTPANFQLNARPGVVAIIGGTTLPVYGLVEEIEAHLSPVFAEVMTFETLEQMSEAQETLVQGMTVLNLTDLDQPFMETQSREKFESLKTLWSVAGPIVWVTKDARGGQPHSYMMVGVGRTIKTEYPNINLQTFDIDALGNHSALLISEALIRHYFLNTWADDAANFLWTIEPEVSIQDGHTMLTRLLPSVAKNDRYNSQRRTVFSDTNPTRDTVRLTSVGNAWQVQKVSPLQRPTDNTADCRTVRITHSLLRSLRIGDFGFFRLCVGIDTATSEAVIALSDTEESPAVIPRQWCIKLASSSSGLGKPQELLASLASYIIADRITSMVPEGDAILVHKPDPTITSAVKHLARERNVMVHFTSAYPSSNPDVRFVHLESSRSVVQDQLPASLGAMVYFPGGRDSESVQSVLAKCLPKRCNLVPISFLLGDEVQSLANIESPTIGQALLQAWKSHTGTVCNDTSSLLSLGDVSSLTGVEEAFAVVDWTAQSIKAKVLPVDSGILFRSDKTYFLVGMAGELGQSLCGWMVVRGARHVVLCSRNPKVNPKFVEAMKKFGANVRSMSLDITSRKSLYSCHKEIVATMPEIIGVVNGAMILRDSLFDSMTYEQFQSVLKPKVEGTKLLDELFFNTKLDFFITTSSINSVIGFSGQSNYSAANTFMTALMYQRKRRGVTGSTMHIPAVLGVGYAAQEDNFDFEYFTTLGYINISEEDFCIMFAEAILSGQLESRDQPEVAAGVNYIPADLQVKEIHRRDVKFSHFIIKEDQQVTSGTKKAELRVKVQLQQAKNKDDVSDIIREGFILKLKRVLQIAEEEAVNDSVALVEQGVDSLVAVQIRSWFLKEVEVDIPVLKVLGGSSISDLIAIAVEKIPEALLTISGPDEAKTAAPQAASPPPASTKLSPLPPANSIVLKHIHKNTTYVSSAVPSFAGTTASLALSSAALTPSLSSNFSPMFTPAGTLSDATASSSGSSPVLKPKGNDDEQQVIPPTLIDISKFKATAQMSFGQTRFWFLHQFLKDKTPFNFSVCACMKGSLDTNAFERAVNLVTQRHESFQTSFFWADGDAGTPTQGVSYRSAFKLEKRQISSEAEAAEELQQLQDHTYDLEHGGAVLMRLLSLSSRVNYFLVGCHHIAFDGQSMHLFISEVDKAYRNQRLEPMLPESQYRAFAAQQRKQQESGLMKADIEYFRDNMGADPKPIELFPFSKVKSRKVMETYKLHKAQMTLDVQTAKNIKQLARKLHCTNFHAYLATLQALVFRLLPDTDRFSVGIADLNRLDSKFIGTFGCLVNLLPITFDRQDASRFADAAKSARDKVYGALQHSQVPFDVLLDTLEISRSGEHTPIFQIFMDYRLGDQQRTIFANCDTEITWNNAATGYDLQLEVLDTNAGESLITLKLQESLYSQYHTELLLRTYMHFLKQLTGDGVGNVALSKPTVWSPHDIDHALKISKGPSLKPSWPSTVGHRIDQIVKSHPSVTAIKDGHGNILTYGQLADRVNTIARKLTDLGAGEGTVVAVFQEPSADWMCSMLAIFRTGATYVPLDLKNGINRLVGSIGVARPHIFLVDQFTAERVPELQLGEGHVVNISDLQTINACPEVPNVAKPDSTAVVLFTSGSTGVPKGIMLPHSCLATHAEGVEAAWNVGPNVVLQQITLSFDFSLHQIFTALANGGTLVVVPSHKRGDPAAIIQLMLDENVSHTLATPTEYSMWFQEGAANLSQCSSWKWALTGGEALPKTTVRDFKKLALTSLKLYDFYGPVETTIAITKGEIRYNEVGLEQALPTGHMLPNYSVYILDENRRPVPTGIPGEIVAGGPGVATGYLRQDELTAEKFIKNPFADAQLQKANWDRLYRTGDQGYLSEDGALYYEGRIDGDTQIKLRGIRIELGEIETAIIDKANGAISQAVVAVHGEAESKFLVAYVLFSAQKDLVDRDGFLANLRSNLTIPSYMQPSQFVVLTSMPMNTHGKTDRKALKSIPLPDVHETRSIDEAAGLTGNEIIVADQWKKVLPSRAASLRPNTDFFHVGGNSLLLVKLQLFLKEAFGAAPRLIELMNSSTLKDMSKLAEKASSASHADWQSDIAIPASWAASTASPGSLSRDNFTIVLTGATGYTGRHLLPRLIEDPRVGEVICLTRNKSSIQQHSEKVRVLVCDLGEDNLGLSSDQFRVLAETADMIIHCAANRSFWDDYEALRRINVLSVKELVRLALPRRLPLHFFTSGAAALVTTDGYLLSKWAAEKLLERAALQLNVPVYLHVPQAAPSDTEPTSDQAVVGAFLDCSRRVGARPGYDGLSGHIDLLETYGFLDGLMDAMFNGKDVGTADPKLTRVHYRSAIRADIIRSIVAGLEGNAEWSSLPTMDPLLWMGEAKKAGFPYVLAAQNITMSSGSGQVVSRR
ncbi:polyketide synthase PksB [Xylaria palmicola]|nr:polyketide synthase PksB [Xylaria palmicola]